MTHTHNHTSTHTHPNQWGRSQEGGRICSVGTQQESEVMKGRFLGQLWWTARHLDGEEGTSPKREREREGEGGRGREVGCVKNKCSRVSHNIMQHIGKLINYNSTRPVSILHYHYPLCHGDTPSIGFLRWCRGACSGPVQGFAHKLKIPLPVVILSVSEHSTVHVLQVLLEMEVMWDQVMHCHGY